MLVTYLHTLLYVGHHNTGRVRLKMMSFARNSCSLLISRTSVGRTSSSSSLRYCWVSWSSRISVSQKPGEDHLMRLPTLFVEGTRRCWTTRLRPAPSWTVLVVERRHKVRRWTHPEPSIVPEALKEPAWNEASCRTKTLLNSLHRTSECLCCGVRTEQCYSVHIKSASSR